MTNQNPALSLSSFPAVNPQLNLKKARPNSFPEHPQDDHRAARLKQLLFDLSKEEEYKDFRSILRNAADSVRQKAFGYNRAAVKRKILKLLSEFFLLEIDDITDETGIPEKEIKAAVAELIVRGAIVAGKRRRFQEVCKHYKLIYSLKK